VQKDCFLYVKMMVRKRTVHLINHLILLIFGGGIIGMSELGNDSKSTRFRLLSVDGGESAVN